MLNKIFSFIFFLAMTLFVSPREGLFAKSHHAPQVLFVKHEAGFFSCFQVVIGMLEEYEKGKYSGVEVNFGKTGLYYDKDFGENWWTYYFSPIHMSPKKSSKPFVLSNSTTHWFISKYSDLAYSLPRARCKELIDKYIELLPPIQNIVQTFIRENFHNGSYIGVQYRGTDKFKTESSYISPEEACVQIELLLEDSRWDKLPIFVATDAEPFFQCMKSKFGDRVVSFSTIRSSDGKGIHFRKDVSGYQKGLEALVDCLLLSESCFFIRTSSNLANCALLFNPILPTICLNTVKGHPHPER